MTLEAKGSRASYPKRSAARPSGRVQAHGAPLAARSWPGTASSGLLPVQPLDRLGSEQIIDYGAQSHVDQASDIARPLLRDQPSNIDSRIIGQKCSMTPCRSSGLFRCPGSVLHSCREFVPRNAGCLRRQHRAERRQAVDTPPESRCSSVRRRAPGTGYRAPCLPSSIARFFVRENRAIRRRAG